MSRLVALVLIVALYFAAKLFLRRRRARMLMDKYGDPEVVQGILRQTIWQGMTTEQLSDSWGRPVAIDDKVYKSKTVQVYKYGQTGKNRFSSRVRIENGSVVGWEQK